MLTDDHLHFFRKYGYLHLPNAIAADEIQAIRSVADSFLDLRDSPPEAWREDFKTGSIVGDDDDSDVSLCRVEYPLGKSRELLNLVAHPQILELAYRLHGGVSILTWEEMIIKVPERGVAVPFHQDLLYQSTRSTVFSIGVYIDDSGASPLHVLPGTQTLGPLTPEQIATLVKERADEIVEVPVKAGDLLVHNVLMVHGSEINRGATPRRVIYFEFRTAEQLQTDSPWSQQWIDARRRYVPAAIRSRRQARGIDQLGDSRFEWAAGLDDDPESVDFRVHHDDVMPGYLQDGLKTT